MARLSSLPYNIHIFVTKLQMLIAHYITLLSYLLFFSHNRNNYDPERQRAVTIEAVRLRKREFKSFTNQLGNSCFSALILCFYRLIISSKIIIAIEPA